MGHLRSLIGSRHSFLNLISILIILIAQFVPGSNTQAAGGLQVTPITWNVIGLDSNNVNSGPDTFPIGVRVCNTSGGTATNLKLSFDWRSTDAYINLASGSGTVYQADGRNLANGACADFYFQVVVTRNSAAYNHVRRYTISAAADGGLDGSTPTPRELYVEHLISQNRNAVSSLQLDGVAVPSGGALVLTVGNTYTIDLYGSTATQGYNQLESFITLADSIFEILSVETVYSATSLSSPHPDLYADSCGWENNPEKPTYRSCVVSDGKSGGSVHTTYQVKVLDDPGVSQSLNTLIYDFSGSSFHYNSDFSSSARVIQVVDPSSVSISSAFTPATTAAGGSSTLTFTLSNPTPVTLSGVSFTNSLPTTPGALLVASSPNPTLSGCGTATFNPTPGSASFSFSDGVIAPNSVCQVSLRVTTPASPTTGTYTNTSGPVYIGEVNTGKTTSTDLGLITVTGGSGICDLTLAQWTLPTSQSDLAFATKATDVTTAAASAGQGLTALLDTSLGSPAGSIQTYGWRNTTPIDTSASPYLQFAIDTTHYTAVKLAFAASRKNVGPSNVVVYSSANGSTWTAHSSFPINPTIGSFSNYGAYDFTGVTNTSGVSYFRFYGNGANTVAQGGDLNLDNIRFSGCGIPQPPTITAAFQTNPVALNAVSQLNFSLVNPNSIDIHATQFSLTLPSGLEISATPNTSTSSCGSPTLSATAGAALVSLSDATITTAGTCQVSVSITATTTGPHTAVTGYVSSTETGPNVGPSGSASATLVALQPPTIQAVYSRNPILADGISTLTYTLGNPNPSDSLPNVAFTSVLSSSPLTLQVAATPNAATTGCGSPTFAPAGGSGSLSFSGATLAAGGVCEVSLDVTAPGEGEYPHTTGPVTTTINGQTRGTDTATASLTVVSPHPALSLIKQIATASSGPWTSFLLVSPGAPVYYRYTVENTGDVPLTSLSLTDSLLNSGDCTLPSGLPVASPVDDPTASCTVGPFNAQTGAQFSLATAQATYNSQPVSAASSAGYLGAEPGLTLISQISTHPDGPWSSQVSDVPPGADLYTRFIVVNNGGQPLNSPSIDADSLDVSSCQLVDLLDTGDAAVCYVGPFPASNTPGDYTITATAQGTGSLSEPVTSNPSAVGYDLASADLTIDLANNTGGNGVLDVPFTWTVTLNNFGSLAAAFADGDPLLTVDLPTGPSYGTPAAGNFSGVDSSGNIQCAFASGDLVCRATGGSVTLNSGSSFTVVFTVTPHSTTSLPATATADPGLVIGEGDETNNTAGDTVAVAETGAPDLIVSLGNDVSGAVNLGGSFTWSTLVTNQGNLPASFSSGQKMLLVTLPDGPTYGSTSLLSSTDVTGAGEIDCAAVTGGFECSASAAVTLALAGHFTITISVTPSAIGTLEASAGVDPDHLLSESDETNNTGSNRVEVNPLSADLAVTIDDGITSASPGQAVTYQIQVNNLGPDPANGSLLKAPGANGVQANAMHCGTALGGAVCPGENLSALQGSGLTISTLPAGGSLTFTLNANLNGSHNLTQAAQVETPAGVTDPDLANNAADVTTPIQVENGDWLSYLPLVYRENPVAYTAVWNISLSYEDLPLSGGQNDFDYNDWVVDIQGGNTYLSASSTLLQEMALTLTPNARGGSYDHAFRLAIPAGTFHSSGQALVTLYDQNHSVVSTQTIPFATGAAIDALIFPHTRDVFPGSLVNSVEGVPTQLPQRTAVVRFTFDTPFDFPLNVEQFDQPHASGLFFHPILDVLNTGARVEPGSVLVLQTPSIDWLWPEEHVRLDRAYPNVIYLGGNPPDFYFPSGWWTTHNNCVYDGLVCGGGWAVR